MSCFLLFETVTPTGHAPRLARVLSTEESPEEFID